MGIFVRGMVAVGFEMNAFASCCANDAEWVRGVRNFCVCDEFGEFGCHNDTSHN